MKAAVKLQLTVVFCCFAAMLAVTASAQEKSDPWSDDPWSDGALVLRAFQHSFPEKIGEVVFADNDWTVQAGGETFYWAGGRLLPAAEKDRLSSYSPWSFEVYPAATPSPAIYSHAYTEALRQRGSNEIRREDHHPGFQAILYGGKTRTEIEALLIPVIFLGKKINVHRDIAPALKRIESKIHAELNAALGAAGNSGLAEFIASIGQVGGYNWREIRGSSRMSYHSWGMALDIQPKKSENRAVYWLWERSRNNNWMLVPLENRWKPHDFVIAAFESEGFIWGGKWPLYDTMHFEYRPELHELNRLLAEQNNAAPADIQLVRPGQDLHHLYPDRLE